MRSDIGYNIAGTRNRRGKAQLFVGILCFVGVFLICIPCAEARPSAAERKAFEAKYNEMKEQGGQAFNDWQSSVFGGSQDEVDMLNHLNAGRHADGKKKSARELAEEQAAQEAKEKGFMGDPNDPGPTDWSDYNIETDANGNVTGFSERNKDEMDTDDDGEVSDAEREEWNKKKKEEDDAAGGPPGDVNKPPEWDQDNDGNPDPGFMLSCYQCKKRPVAEPFECVHGWIGECDSHACDQNEECIEHTETHDGQEVTCRECLPKEEIVGFCASGGYYVDPACGGACPAALCVPLDIHKETGKVMSPGETRERGSTERCYTCMKNVTIDVTWVVIIIETPFERYVLGKGKPGDTFKPTSVMALAKTDGSGKIQDLKGQFKALSDFTGGFSGGFGLQGLTSTGMVSMDQLSSMLGAGLDTGGSYGSDCFGPIQEEADKKAAEQGTPTSKDMEGTSKGRKQDKDRREREIVSEKEAKTADQTGSPAVTGPIVACGNEGKDKVLRIYDSGGALIDTITKEMLRLNPGIITEKLGVAQQAADVLIAKSGFDFAGYVERFTGIPLKDAQQIAGQIASVKAEADRVKGLAEKSKRKRKKQTEEEIIIPNDPLYKVSDVVKKKEKKKAKQNRKINLGSNLKIGGERLGAPDKNVDELEEAEKVPDQYALPIIGYTPVTDPDSAWNVIDANQKNVVVAVIDSGLDMTHPDGPEHIWTNPKEVAGNGIDDDGDGFVDDIHGWNFIDENHDFTDVRGHGTFVAGIIAAKQNNGIGIAGINPGAVIMPIKVADDEGVTNSLSIYRGINYAVHHGAKVINVSLGARTISKLEQQAIERAQEMGALVVVAAGNNNENIVNFGPSSSPHALAVGQIDHNGQRSPVSNWGPNLSLVAPGEQIYSLCSKDNKHVLPSIRKAGYFKDDGTSFSTPMVAATASLIWAKNPDLSNRQVAEIILANTKDMEAPGWDGMTGAGLLDAAKALRADPEESPFVMITNLRVNRNAQDKVISVDVYGTVRGGIKDYTVEAGKGRNAGRFERIAGPFSGDVDAAHIARVNVQESLRGSKDWIIRLKATDNNGAEYIASTPFDLPK